MGCEILELKRCCFCIPLRYGLIVWAYIKLLLGIAVMLYFMDILATLIQFYFRLDDKIQIIEQLVIVAIIVTLVVVDNVLCILFLVSAHKKLYRIMRIYYIYLLVMLGVTTLLFLSFFVLRLLYAAKTTIDERGIVTMVAQSIAEFLNIVLQIYFIILVRSEIRKLSANCQFRFSNNAVEAECAMIMTPGCDVAGEANKNEPLESDVSFNGEKIPLGFEKLND